MSKTANATLKTIPRRKAKFAEVKRTRTTVTLDDELIRKAQLFTGVTEKAALIREALTQLVQREGARRLAALGGSEPTFPIFRAGGCHDNDSGTNNHPRRHKHPFQAFALRE
jgi:Arc/MetJ family transcription regulator